MPIPAADDRFAFSGHVPGDADARGEVLLVGIVEAAQAGLTDLRESKSFRLTGQNW